MKLKLLAIGLMLALAAPYGTFAQLTSSNLPILVITTDDGNDVPDEPKVGAHLGIVWGGDGSTNYLNAAFNHFDGKIAIEKRGSSSQDLFPKNGYAFETRDSSGANLDVPLLGFPDENDWILHGPYSDKSLMRNALAYTMASWIMDYAPRVKFCEVVLNGDYRGVYVLTEKIKRDEHRVNISTLNPDENSGDDLTGGFIMRFDKWDNLSLEGFPSPFPPLPNSSAATFFLYHYPAWDEITPPQKNYIQQYLLEAETALISTDFKDTMQGYRKYFDIPSFIQFMFVQEIARNVDAYRLSTYFYKDKESQGGKLKMGPVWDYNLGFGNVDYCIGSGTAGWAYDFNDVCPGDFWVVHFWWKRMLEDSAFVGEMAQNWQTLRASTLGDDHIFHLIDSLENLLQSPAQRNFQRWPVLGQYIWPNAYVGKTYQQEVDYLRNWLQARLQWLDAQFEMLSDTTPPGNASGSAVQVFPNPFSDETSFYLHAPGPGHMRVEIFDFKGQKILELTNREKLTGTRKIVLDNLPVNGMYFYRVWYQSRKLGEGKILRQ